MHVVETAKPTNWPKPMAPAAFIGVAGDFVRLIGPHTEADPVALLANFLCFSGMFFGRSAWAEADGKKNYPVEFVLTAGATSSGRKAQQLLECAKYSNVWTRFANREYFRA